MQDEPRWVWDIWGTGIRAPEKPAWYEEWQKEILLSQDQVEERELEADRYDELKKYFEDLDAHRGIKIPGPKKIAFWAWYG